MSTKEPVPVFNMDDIEQRRRLMAKIGKMRGLWSVSLEPRKKTRSLQANGYYWAAYIPAWLEWLREASGEPWITKDQAHKALVKHVLGTQQVVNKETGELIDEITPETHTMDTGDFNNYLDRAAEFLASFCGIVIIPSELFFEGATEGKSK